MSLIRNLDGAEDWVFGHGFSDYASREFCVGLNVKTRVREWKYDWFANYLRGIDWKTRLGHKNQKEALDEDVQDVILQTKDVISLESFVSDVDPNTRTYKAECSIKTPYGIYDFDISLGGF